MSQNLSSAAVVIGALRVECRFVCVSQIEPFINTSGSVTVKDSQSGKSFSSILNLAKNVHKPPINEYLIKRS